MEVSGQLQYLTALATTLTVQMLFTLMIYLRIIKHYYYYYYYYVCHYTQVNFINVVTKNDFYFANLPTFCPWCIRTANYKHTVANLMQQHEGIDLSCISLHTYHRLTANISKHNNYKVRRALKEHNTRMWNQFEWLMVRAIGGLLWTRKQGMEFHKKAVNFWNCSFCK